MILWAGVLAAGAGRRLGGQPKALLEIDGQTFLEKIAATALEARVQGVAVVVGHHREVTEPHAGAVADLVAINADPDRGMISSARALARAVPDGAAMLLWPVDQPAIHPSTVRALAAAGAAAPDRVVAPTHGGEPGHPPLLPPALVAVLRTADDTSRLDEIIAERGAPLTLAVDDPGVSKDVDTPEDLEVLKGGRVAEDEP